MLPECVYLDYNATTPIFPEVAEEMMPFLETHFGNPSSIHAYAKPCSEAIRLSRERVKLAIGAKSGQKEVLFTSCGTESDNRAIDVACDVFVNCSSNSCPHVITTEVEHPAVLVYLESEQKAKRLTYSLVPVDDEGVAKINEYKKQLEEFNERVCCVSIMQANNETGVIQPVRAFADLANLVLVSRRFSEEVSVVLISLFEKPQRRANRATFKQAPRKYLFERALWRSNHQPAR